MPDMRFAPPNPLRIADRASGLNSVSVRGYNERLVLSLLLQSEATTRLEIGERTGLSAQTVSVLVRSLEQEGLVARGEAQKGRVGPPTVPLALNPEGAFSIGIGVGHRGIDVVLIDFVGTVRFHRRLPHPESRAGSNNSRFLETIAAALALLPDRERARLAGVGLALPTSRTAGREQEGYFSALQEEIEAQLGVAVFVQNDITAAASGESMFGVAKPLTDYMFFYLGARLHGRLVLNHQIHNGNSPVSFDVGIEALQTRLEAVGVPTKALWDRSGDWSGYVGHLDAWREELVERMATSLQAVAQFVEVKTVVLSSCAPPGVCRDLCSALRAEVGETEAIASSLAPSPKAIGAASLPLSSRFMVD